MLRLDTGSLFLSLSAPNDSVLSLCLYHPDAGRYTGWGRDKVRLGQAEGERKERKRSKYSREVFNGVRENDECYVYKRFGFNTTLH